MNKSYKLDNMWGTLLHGCSYKTKTIKELKNKTKPDEVFN